VLCGPPATHGAPATPARRGWPRGAPRNASLDDLDADLLLSGSDYFKAAPDNRWDERCSIKQVYEWYEDCITATANTLAWQKINYDLVKARVVFVADSGSRDCPLPKEGFIRVFLPGMQEIITLHDNLNSHPRIGRCGKFLLVPLHSSLSSEEQQLVFSKPRVGQRNIVILTGAAAHGLPLLLANQGLSQVSKFKI